MLHQNTDRACYSAQGGTLCAVAGLRVLVLTSFVFVHVSPLAGDVVFFVLVSLTNPNAISKKILCETPTH